MTTKLKVLTPSRMAQAEYARIIWAVAPEPNTTPDELLEPRFWAHRARDLRPGHRIEACPDDKAWWAEYLVLSVDETGARLFKMRVVDLRQDVPVGVTKSESISDFEVKFQGGEKWCVIRKADRRTVKSKFQTEAEARGWLAETHGEESLA